MKKLFSILLMLCIVANLICIPAATTIAATYEGVWEYTTSGTEATITAYTGAEITVTVPETVSDGTNTYTVTSIGNGTESIDQGGVLVNVTLPSTIKKINDKAFQGMAKGGFNINFPEGLEEIGAQAFYNTNKKGDTLLNIVLPSTLKKIGKSAFYYCSRTTSITFTSVNAPEIASNGNSKEAFWNLGAKPVIYYPENGVGYDAAAFRNEFSSTNAVPVAGSNALTFAYIGTSATAAPTATATPKPDPSATATPVPTATPTPTPEPTATPEPVWAENPVLYINEICPSNTTVNDGYGNYADYIEIYNASDGAVNLEGYGLSDSANKPFEYVIPSTVIHSGQFLVIFTAKDVPANATGAYANFGISKSGETIYFTNPDGELVDSMELPNLGDDEVYGRYPDGNKSVKILTQTAGKSNNTADILSTFVEQPVFSVESGFYADEFDLDLTSAPGTTIYYTLDGSDPDPANTTTKTYTTDNNHSKETIPGTNEYTIDAVNTYTSPIKIQNVDNNENKLSTITHGISVNSGKYNGYPTVKVDKCMIVRAIAVDAEGNQSRVATKSYFVGEKYQDLQELYGDSVVISIVTDPHNLFGYENGIYNMGKMYYESTEPIPSDANKAPAHYNQHGREWEREAHMDFFENDGTLGFSQEVGIRVRGRWARHFVQRSFGIYARSDYDESTFNYPLFEDNRNYYDGGEITEYKSFMLRNGGDTGVDALKYRDPYQQETISDFSTIATQDWRPAVLFIDGEFWGPYSMQEHYREEFFEYHYGVPEEYVVTSDSDAEIQNMYKAPVTNLKTVDITVEENYETAKENIDIYNAMDYFLMQTYYGNGDWTSTNFMNWYSGIDLGTEFGDHKYRHALFDMDRSGRGDYTTNHLNLHDHRGHMTFGWTLRDNPGSQKYPGLLANMDYRREYVTRASDLINIAFDPERVVGMINEADDTYIKTMPLYYSRFDNTVTGGANSLSTYTSARDDAIEFVTNRPKYYRQHMQECFELGDFVDVTVNADSEKGSVQMTTVLPIDIPLENNTWTGEYVTDYPINVTAEARSGYKFAGWTVTGGATIADPSAETATVTLTGNATLVANFESLADAIEGNGTQASPYIIKTADDLKWMSDVVNNEYANYGDKYYELGNDIVLTGENNYTPVGNAACPFIGHFDGKNHSVSGISIVETTERAQGLFGYVGEGGTVKNVAVLDCDISAVGSNGKNIGAIVGNNGGLIDNCYSTGTVKGISTVGGIVGNNNGGTVTDCYSICTVLSDSANTLGGVAGKTESGGSVSNCYSLINPVAKNDGGTVDAKTRIVTEAELADGTVAALLGEGWKQGENSPVFGTGEVKLVLSFNGNNVVTTKKVTGKVIIGDYVGTRLVDVIIYDASSDTTFPIPETFTNTVKAMLVKDVENIEPLCTNISE